MGSELHRSCTICHGGMLGYIYIIYFEVSDLPVDDLSHVSVDDLFVDDISDTSTSVDDPSDLSIDNLSDLSVHDLSVRGVQHFKELYDTVSGTTRRGVNTEASYVYTFGQKND